MLSLTTTAGVMRTMRGARCIELCSYVSPSKWMLRSLEAAAANGARVRVRLEALPYGDRTGQLARENRRAVSDLRAARVDARLGDRSGRHPNHMKAAVIDGVAFLDDRNWPSDPRNLVVRDGNRHEVSAVRSAMHGRVIPAGTLAVTKGVALSQEATLLSDDSRTRGAVDVQTEAFTAGTAPYTALKRLAACGVPVRLLISRRDLRPAAIGALKVLARCGVTIRATDAGEKLTVCEGGAWIGSANASFGGSDQIDWGARMEGRAVCKALAEHFEANWSRARPLEALQRPNNSRAFASVICMT